MQTSTSSKYTFSVSTFYILWSVTLACIWPNALGKWAQIWICRVVLPCKFGYGWLGQLLIKLALEVHSQDRTCSHAYLWEAYCQPLKPCAAPKLETQTCMWHLFQGMGPNFVYSLKHLSTLTLNISQMDECSPSYQILFRTGYNFAFENKRENPTHLWILIEVN